jgi:hypothetical protein
MQQIEDHEFEAIMWTNSDIEGIIDMIRDFRGEKRPRKVAEAEEAPKQKVPSLQDLGFKPKANSGIMRR